MVLVVVKVETCVGFAQFLASNLSFSLWVFSLSDVSEKLLLGCLLKF